MTGADVIVVGAGPVGMLAALLSVLGGASVLLLEQSAVRQRQSRAIGISPPSLEILSRAGLAEAFITQGVAVGGAEVYGRCRHLGKIDFGELPGDYPFVLSIPQDRTEKLLEEAVRAQQSIRFLRGCHVTHCTENEDGITVYGTCASGEFDCSGKFVLACDGGRSSIRESSGIPFDGASDRYTYLMGDFEDTTDWGNRAFFFLTPRGSVESFPLPDGARRYVLRSPVFIKEYTSDYLGEELLRRTGMDISGVNRMWESGFGVQHFVARRFCANRVFLCGDAAHLMSPIGGQNMNTGFADAELAAWLTGILIEKRAPNNLACGLYDRVRRQAAKSALLRAQVMMLTGTTGGYFWSAVRNPVTSYLLHSPLRRYLAQLFSMHSIPCRNLRMSRKIYESELKL
jgi:2-polyprenyl-6-methoxyphenol hydroxylase-like FAD-dependent oxidoreductase